MGDSGTFCMNIGGDQWRLLLMLEKVYNFEVGWSKVDRDYHSEEWCLGNVLLFLHMNAPETLSICQNDMLRNGLAFALSVHC